MKYPSKSITEATAQELLTFAAMAYGVEMPTDAEPAQIVGALRKAGFAGDEIRIIPRAPVPSRAAKSSEEIPDHSYLVRKENGVDREYARILIHRSDKPGGNDPVFVGVNGVAMYIPRGEPVAVPIEYVRILQNAVEHHYPEARDMRAEPLGQPELVSAYPFSWA